MTPAETRLRHACLSSTGLAWAWAVWLREQHPRRPDRQMRDSALRDALLEEVSRLRDTKEFGLVFERHLPETVLLWAHPIRRGMTVRERSWKASGARLVKQVDQGMATLVGPDGEETQRSLDQLVVVRDFGQPAIRVCDCWVVSTMEGRNPPTW